MSITTILFDLDGTLLPMDQDVFAKAYIKGLTVAAEPVGYSPMILGAAIMAGTSAMIKNTGEKTNEDVFWHTLEKTYGEASINNGNRSFQLVSGIRNEMLLLLIAFFKRGYNPLGKIPCKEEQHNDGNTSENERIAEQSAHTSAENGVIHKSDECVAAFVRPVICQIIHYAG